MRPAAAAPQMRVGGHTTEIPPNTVVAAARERASAPLRRYEEEQEKGKAYIPGTRIKFMISIKILLLVLKFLMQNDLHVIV